MRLTLISPRLALQKGDFLGSGVPYWPIETAVLAAFLRDRGHHVGVLDLFGADPRRLEERRDHFLQGRPLADYAASAAVRGADAFVVHAISYMSHGEIREIAAALATERPGVPILALENTQAVTGYAVSAVADELLAAGFTGLICGEPYWNWSDIEASLSSPGSATPANVLTARRRGPATRQHRKDGEYPVPAWDLVPLTSYWRLPYAHGPKTRTFLPILTSRGCPYPCDFCVVPETNALRWRARSPAAVVDEILELRDRFDVRDFQVEDLNPTVKRSRWRDIAELLIERDAGVRFYFVSGTKAETVPVEDVPLLARAGLRYLSISPESGSARVMKSMGKPFDYGHGEQLVAACRGHGVATQACFLVGHPSEHEADFALSARYLRRLVRRGLDEVAVFVVAPLPGSAVFRTRAIEVARPDSLVSFSPRGRADWQIASRRRRALIRLFFFEKLRGGFSLWAQGVRALAGVPRTKMENLPRRAAYVTWLILRHRLAALTRARR
jgi:Radical SAM superfamily